MAKIKKCYQAVPSTEVRLLLLLFKMTQNDNSVKDLYDACLEMRLPRNSTGIDTAIHNLLPHSVHLVRVDCLEMSELLRVLYTVEPSSI